MSNGSIHNLTESARSRDIACDVCIVGAGPVGLTLARTLAERGRHVVIVEAGAAQAKTPDDAIHFERRIYRGATHGRASGLGGTSTLWGGQLLPLRPSDLSARRHAAVPGWPIAHSDIDMHVQMLERWLSVASSPYDTCNGATRKHPLTGTAWGEWAPRWSKWIPFGSRNISSAWRHPLAGTNRVQIWLNAAATRWDFQNAAGSRRLAAVMAQSGNGNLLQIRAKSFAICAGALESARTVLEMNEQATGLAEGVEQLTGRYLHDHLSVRMARVHVIDRNRFQELFAPAFQGATMRSLRLELSAQTLARAGLPALYAHFAADTAMASGFSVVRDMLKHLQRRDLAAAMLCARKVPGALPGIAELLYWRIAKQRLVLPQTSTLYLHVDFEQMPRAENRLLLGEMHASGRRAVHIDWDIDHDEVGRVADAVSRALRTLWHANGFERIVRLEFIGNDSEALSNTYDIFHPAGTTRMAADPSLGVVDGNLRIHGTTNAFVVGSSVFPSMGAANPTLTAMALASRLGNHLARRITAGEI